MRVLGEEKYNFWNKNNIYAWVLYEKKAENNGLSNWLKNEKLPPDRKLWGLKKFNNKLFNK